VSLITGLLITGLDWTGTLQLVFTLQVYNEYKLPYCSACTVASMTRASLTASELGATTLLMKGMATGLLGLVNDPIVVDLDSEELPLSSYESPFKVAKSRLDEGHLCEVAGPRLSSQWLQLLSCHFLLCTVVLDLFSEREEEESSAGRSEVPRWLFTSRPRAK